MKRTHLSYTSTLIIAGAFLLITSSCSAPVTPAASPGPSPTPTPTPTPVLVLHGPEWPTPAQPQFAYADINGNAVDESLAGRQAGLSGGLVIKYSNFTMSAVNNLWWGFEPAYPPQLSFTGSTWEPEETLSFSLIDSDLENGLAVWKGAIRLRYYNNGLKETNVPVKCTVRVSGSGASSFIEADVIRADYPSLHSSVEVLAPITGNANVTILYEVFFNSAWQPAAAFFDSLSNDPADQCMISFGPAFAYTVYE